MPKRKRKEDGSKKKVKYKGVYKTGERFNAKISVNRKTIDLGTFDTLKEGAQAYDRAAIQAGRPTSTLNFVPKSQKFGLKNNRSKVAVKYMGVTKIEAKKGERFRAEIYIDGKTRILGTFDTPKEAAEAYDFAAIQAGRPTSKMNFLDQVPKIYKPKNNGLRSNNTIGYVGVYKKKNRFRAEITIGGKKQHIGTFDTAKEAAIAFDFAAIEAKRPKSSLNFPNAIFVTEKRKF